MTRLMLPVGLLAMALGCTPNAPDGAVGSLSADEVTLLRKQLLLDVEPPDVKTVIGVRDAVAPASQASETSPEATSVAVAGQIGGMPNPYGDDTQPQFPWVNGQAIFFLVDPTTAAQFENHQHAKGEECSFCMGKARDLVNTVAMVRLIGQGDSEIPARADKLLGLAEGENVVVTGTARNELGMVVIDAVGVHPRTPEVAKAAAEEMETQKEETQKEETQKGETEQKAGEEIEAEASASSEAADAA